MSAERFKEFLQQQLRHTPLDNQSAIASFIDAVYEQFHNAEVIRITTEDLAQKLGLPGRVSVARQLLEGLGSQAKMDPLKPGVPLSNTYWTVEASALAALIANVTPEQQ